MEQSLHRYLSKCGNNSLRTPELESQCYFHLAKLLGLRVEACLLGWGGALKDSMAALLCSVFLGVDATQQSVTNGAKEAYMLPFPKANCSR